MSDEIDTKPTNWQVGFRSLSSQPDPGLRTLFFLPMR